MALFKKNNSGNEKKNEFSNSKTIEEIKITIKEDGHTLGLSQQGDANVFRAALSDLYTNFQKKCREDENYQEESKKPIRDNIVRLEGEKQGIEKQRDVLKNQELSRIESEINNCENAINEVEGNPKKYGISENVDPTVRTYFTIGCIILAAIGVFLAIFYMSASYSAFFKDWNLDEGEIGLGAKIFDGNAFVNAWQDSPTTGLFCTLIFVIFLGLGFLLHVFQKDESRLRWIKILALLIITFIFDFILAYKIESNIFELTKVYGQVFGILIAFQTIGFWAIIFAGFVTYIIWGLVFDFTMTKWEEFSPIYLFKRKKEKELDKLKRELKTIIKQIKELDQKIIDINPLIEKERESLVKVFIPTSEYKNWHNAFVLGWLTGITSCALSETEKDKRKTECGKIGEEFLNNITSEE